MSRALMNIKNKTTKIKFSKLIEYLAKTKINNFNTQLLPPFPPS